MLPVAEGLNMICLLFSDSLWSAYFRWLPIVGVWFVILFLFEKVLVAFYYLIYVSFPDLFFYVYVICCSWHWFLYNYSWGPLFFYCFGNLWPLPSVRPSVSQISCLCSFSFVLLVFYKLFPLLGLVLIRKSGSLSLFLVIIFAGLIPVVLCGVTL